MKKLILVFAMIFAAQLSFAQAWKGKGDQKVQVGFNGWGYGTGITGTYDYGIADMVSVGAGANAYFSGYKDGDKANNFFVFGRLNLHLQDILNLPSKWDVYPGLDVGVLGKGFGLGAHVGVRYFFQDNIGLYLEAGNNGSLGVSFNF